MHSSLKTKTLSALVTRQKAAFDAGDYAAATALAAEAGALALETCSLRNHRGAAVELSIIVVSYRGTAETLAMVDFLGRLMLDISHEVILVLNDDRNLRHHPFPESMTVVDVAANMGAAGGRNIGAHFASGRYLLFLDDDGETDAASIMALHRAAVAHDATGVRGRVRPRDRRAPVPACYDLGNLPGPSMMDIEGMTIWHAGRFRQAGGHDPLLYGHEGPELFWRLYRQHGPLSFLYEPGAVLIHDPGSQKAPRPAGESRYRTNLRYLDWKRVPYGALLRMTERAGSVPDQRAAIRNCLDEVRALQDATLPRRPLVSILTTLRDAAPEVADFCDSLKRQSYQEFELIVVDDGAADATLAELSALWAGDRRLRLLPSRGVGRGGALNTALADARGEICVIADAADIMVERRIEWSVWRLLEGRDCVACLKFDPRHALLDPLPLALVPGSVRQRRLVGVPADPSTLAFRRERFTQPAPETEGGGSAVEWLFRNLAADPTLDGAVLPFPGVFSAPQDAATLEAEQCEAALRCVAALHRAMIEFDEDADLATLSGLIGCRPLRHPARIAELQDYALRFHAFPGAAEVRQMILGTVRELQLRQLLRAEAKPKATPKPGGKAAGGGVAPAAPAAPDPAFPAFPALLAEELEEAWVAQYRQSRRFAGRLAGLLTGLPTGRQPPPTPRYFDEDAYLAQNPDVAAEVAKGAYPSGFAHFALHGRAEGRRRTLREGG